MLYTVASDHYVLGQWLVGRLNIIIGSANHCAMSD